MYDTFLQSSGCNVCIYNGLLYASSLMPSGVSTWCIFGMTIQTKGKTMNALTCCYSVMANSSIWFSAMFNSRTGAVGTLDPDPDWTGQGTEPGVGLVFSSLRFLSPFLPFVFSFFSFFLPFFRYTKRYGYIFENSYHSHFKLIVLVLS